MTIYIFDTSAIADIFERYYPSDVFPSIGQLFENVANEGRIVVPRDVYDELAGAAYCGWLDSLEVVQDIEEVLSDALLDVMKDVGRKMVDPRDQKNGADPIVLAYAVASDSEVVTGEVRQPSATWMKLPDACDARRVPCHDVLGFFRAERLRL